MATVQSVPLADAANRLAELVQRSREAHEGVVITEGGVPVAAVIGIETLEELRRAQDELDIALCERAMRRRGEALTDSEFAATVAREDANSA